MSNILMIIWSEHVLWVEIAYIDKINGMTAIIILRYIIIHNYYYMHALRRLFLTEGWGCVNLMIFIWEFLRFGLTQRKHYSR